MDNLNELVWRTSNPKPSSNSNGQGRLSPSSSNIGNNKSGTLPFNSAPQGVSPQKQPFGSYAQKTLNPSINTASSTSPRSFSPSNSLPRKPPLDKVGNDPFENLVNLGGSAKKSSTAGLSL
ncbi:hypothetical protein K7432_005762 [Basidiobolus ranarum]|uniref:Uncharacterized protein n=1 Tax=Basidiobolus ranarum TaxID=34480 RepID=A0ABR2WW21_9FUNG